MTKPEPLKDKINQFRDNYGNNHDNYFLENDVKAAIKFYKRYREAPRLLRNEKPKTWEVLIKYWKKNLEESWDLDDLFHENWETYEYILRIYNYWLLNIAFQDVVEK